MESKLERILERVIRLEGFEGFFGGEGRKSKKGEKDCFIWSIITVSPSFPHSRQRRRHSRDKDHPVDDTIQNKTLIPRFLVPITQLFSLSVTTTIRLLLDSEEEKDGTIPFHLSNHYIPIPLINKKTSRMLLDPSLGRSFFAPNHSESFHHQSKNSNPSAYSPSDYHYTSCPLGLDRQHGIQVRSGEEERAGIKMTDHRDELGGGRYYHHQQQQQQQADQGGEKEHGYHHQQQQRGKSSISSSLRFVRSLFFFGSCIYLLVKC